MPVVVGYVLCQVALSARLIVTPTSLHINVTPGCALLIMTVSVTSALFLRIVCKVSTKSRTFNHFCHLRTTEAL